MNRFSECPRHSGRGVMSTSFRYGKQRGGQRGTKPYTNTDPERVGWPTGFEPATARSTIWGSNRAELRPPTGRQRRFRRALRQVQLANHSFLRPPPQGPGNCPCCSRLEASRAWCSHGTPPPRGPSRKELYLGAFFPSSLSGLGNAIVSDKLNSRAAGASETHGYPFCSD